jgi:hypothetical protein
MQSQVEARLKAMDMPAPAGQPQAEESKE